MILTLPLIALQNKRKPDPSHAIIRVAVLLYSKLGCIALAYIWRAQQASYMMPFCCRNEDFALAIVDGAFLKALEIHLVRKVRSRDFVCAVRALGCVCNNCMAHTAFLM